MSAHLANSYAGWSSGSLLVDLIERRIDRLAGQFGVGSQAALIHRTYRTLSGESLAIAPDQCVPERSRINADGTPFQFALHLGRREAPALQFLGEAGVPGSSIVMRSAAASACLDRLGAVLNLSDDVALVRPWLAEWTAHRDADAGAAMAGALWFALAFAPAAPPTLTVYLNGAWGRAPDRWTRLRALAARLGARFPFEDAIRNSPLAPLGAAIVLSGKRPLRGRVYFSGYGLAVPGLRDLATLGATTDSAGTAFDGFAHHLLGDDARYPTQSVVFSHELSPAPSTAVKIELCAHCAFEHDRQAAQRTLAWLTAAGLQSDCYRATIDTLRGSGALSSSGRPDVHAFVGVGIRRGDPYASIYLNPGPLMRTL